MPTSTWVSWPRDSGACCAGKKKPPENAIACHSSGGQSQHDGSARGGSTQLYLDLTKHKAGQLLSRWDLRGLRLIFIS